MSLQVWLPMTKDSRNQGLADITITNSGATYSATGGKLGGCYVFDGSDDSIGIGNLSTLVNTDFTFACWFYHDNTWSSKGYETLLGGPSGFELESKVSTTNSPVLKLYNWGGGSCIYELNKWNHVVFTRNTTETKLYLNGELQVTGTAGTIPSGDYFIGAWKTSAQQNFKGNMNDVRIYDHCLSPMEVKQISQGLILHYPLNRQGWGQENLITQAMISADPWKSAISGTYTIDGKTGWILSNNQLYSKSGNGVNNIFSGLTYEANTQYTISFKWRDDYRTDDKSSSLYIRFKYSDGTYSQVISSKDYNYWKEEIMTSTAGKTVSAITTTYGNGGNLLFTDLKLEKGAIKTPTSPIVNSDLYNSMGLNSNIEYDTSGYCNNGMRTGIFTWTSNTPKYAVSQIFNGTDNAIQTPSLPTMISDKNYTVACWTYKTVIGTKNYQTIYGGPSGFELEARSSSSTSPLYRIHNWGGGTTAYNFGEWTHFCFVHTDSDSKLYVNGELKITGTSVNIPSGNYFVGAWNTSTQQNFEGSMSDFRIYATALSASDVKSLYQNCATIDADGTIYGQIRN